MTAKSNYLENAIINHVLRDTAYTSPGSNVWLALYTDSQGEADSGTEVSGGSYARIRVQGTSDWDAPANGDTENTNDESFPQASASWGSVVSVGIKDSSTSTGTDNLLYYGDLASPKTVNNGDTFKFNAGDLDVAET